jgi:predicted secreted acid phosphatase
MKKTAFLIVFALLLNACSPTLLDLTHAKKEVKDYYELGQYDKEMDEIIKNTLNQLEGKNFSPNSAAIFDIDETALNNYPQVKSLDFGDDGKMWDQWVYSMKARAIPQVKKLYDFLVSKGVKIFFITGRYQRYYDASRKNLMDAGYSKIDSIICRQQDEAGVPAAQYKSKHRAQLVKQGLNIILNIGDQNSDLDGGNSGLRVKIPNYLYVID